MRRVVERPSVDLYRRVREWASDTVVILEDNEMLFKGIGDERQKRALEGTMTLTI